mmetsp:Transcript_366/g.884  ORF Transcript_366/g.884 Transcript_366/m.884 type:complete len:124 (-) Transcript_366:125-496(-)
MSTMLSAPVYSVPFATSTIFKRHETRNDRHQQPPKAKTTMTIKAIDGTIGETFAQLLSSNRSTIFQMHSKRHEESHRQTTTLSPKMIAVDQYQEQGFSVANMTKTSSIYQRNVRRAQTLRQSC